MKTMSSIWDFCVNFVRWTLSRSPPGWSSLTFFLGPKNVKMTSLFLRWGQCNSPVDMLGQMKWGGGLKQNSIQNYTKKNNIYLLNEESNPNHLHGGGGHVNHYTTVDCLMSPCVSMVPRDYIDGIVRHFATEYLLRLYEMDAIFTSTMLRFTINTIKMTYEIKLNNVCWQ